MTLEAGRTLGHYEILSSLGAGGMGEVYRARDTRLGREVAIKLLLEEVANDPERLARFEREARVLASLNHPHIATLHGFEADGDTHFLVMELVEGETLADRIARGPIPIEEAIPIFVRIAEGLEAAHDKGVIHRDLKPANVKVAANGRVKILDFGLAKALVAESGASAASELSHSPTLTLAATQRGQILGTAAYMSPEQAKGKAVDRRSDIWSFGACLFEALAGQRAFRGDDASDLLGAVLIAQPEWDRLPAGTSPLVRRLLRRCLEKDPARRLQHIGDARLELEEVATAAAAPRDAHAESPAPAAGAARARSRVLALALGALLLATAAWIATASGWLGRPPSAASRSAEVTRFAIELRGAQQVATDVDALSFAISPDGRRIAWIGLEEPERRIFARSLDRLEMAAVPGTEGVSILGLNFSPDGRELLFHRDGALWRIPAEGGLATKVLEGETKTSLWVPDWAENGIFLPLSRGGLIRADAAGGPPETLTELAADREGQHVNPRGVPQANAVLFGVGGLAGFGFGQDHVELLSLDSGERTVVLERALCADYVGTGHLVFGRGDTLFAAPFDLERRVTGPEVPLLDGLALDTYSMFTQFVVSDAGTLVYVPEQGLHDRQPTWVWSDGRSEPIDLPAARYRSARLSPDGARLAVHLPTTMGGRLRILSLDTGVVESVEAFETHNSEPVWGPTGRSLLFSGASPRLPDLFMLDLDADEAPVRLTESPHQHFANDWSADGKRVVFTERRRDDQLDIYILDLTKENAPPEPYATSIDSEALARFSPNGRWIAFVKDVGGTPQIFVSTSEREGVRPPERQVSRGGGWSPVWSPDGGKLYYVTGDGDALQSVSVGSTDSRSLAIGTEQRVLTDLRLPPADWLSPSGFFDIHPDGDRFLMLFEREVESMSLVVVENWIEELKRLVPAR